MVKKPPANAGDATDAGSIPGLGKSPGGGNGNTLHYSCLENFVVRRLCPSGCKELDTTEHLSAHTQVSLFLLFYVTIGTYA